MRPTHTLIGVLLWSNFTIVEKDIHILAGVVEDALHSRAQEIGKINSIPQVNTSIPCPIYIFKEGHAACFNIANRAVLQLSKIWLLYLSPLSWDRPHIEEQKNI